jgi:hypothetical protein
MKTLSLRARLTLWYTLALLVVLLLFGVNVLVEQQRLGIRRADREIDSARVTLANLLREELGEHDSPALAATEVRNAIGPLGNAIAILDRSGAPLAVQFAICDALAPNSACRRSANPASGPSRCFGEWGSTSSRKIGVAAHAAIARSPTSRASSTRSARRWSLDPDCPAPGPAG